jgi:hypothetical protein
VNLDGAPMDRASEGILGPAMSVRPQEDEEEERPQRYRSPVVAQTPMRRVMELATDLLQAAQPPWTKQKKIIAGAVGGAAVIGLLLIIIALAGGGDRTKNASAALIGASASPSQSALPGTTTVASAKTPTAVPDRPVNADIDDDPMAMLVVKANAPIAKVALPDRVIDAVVPAPSVGIDLAESDQGKTLKVTVTSTDGRTAVATAEPGTRDLEVTFGDKPAPSPPTTRPVTTTAGGKDKDKRTWPKRTAR